jgi:5-keto 4-deoxyuronate isomerase
MSYVLFRNGNIDFANCRFGKGQISFKNSKFHAGSKDFQYTSFGDGEVLFVNTDFGDGDVSFINSSSERERFPLRLRVLAREKLTFITPNLAGEKSALSGQNSATERWISGWPNSTKAG